MPPKKNQKFSQHKNRQFSSPEEIQQQLSKLDVEDEEEETSSEEDTSSGDSSSDDDTPKRGKGVQDLIQIENPNRNPKKADPDEKAQLSRREREELNKQRAKERYDKMHAEGKTDQAKADLARLAEIRRRREEEAAKRSAATTTAAKPAPSKK